MDPQSDTRYLQLYREFSKAIQAFENATKERRQVRNRLAVERSPVIQALQQMDRRPVGSPPDTRIPPASAGSASGSASNTFEPRRVYMGNILGWAKLVPTPNSDPKIQSNAVDVDRLYDRISLQLYWSAKAHYLKCKRAFFDYVRQRNIEIHYGRAGQRTQHGANLQYLGVEMSDDPPFLQEARKEIDAACRNVWGLYQSSGPQKSTEMKALLLEAIANAQFVDLQSLTVQAMTAEMNRLMNAGEVSKGD